MLQEHVNELSAVQKELAILQDDLRKEKEAFEKDNDVLFDSIATLKEKEQSVKADIDREAHIEYSKTGNKKLYGGIGVRETKSISYDDKKALQFAKEKDMFLTLDKKAFEKAAGSLGLDFIETIITPKVTFPKEIKVGE